MCPAKSPDNCTADTTSTGTLGTTKHTALNDLPALTLQTIIARLDHATRLALRCACKRCMVVVDRSWCKLQLPVDQLQQYELAKLLHRFPAAQALQITPAELPRTAPPLAKHKRWSKALVVLFDDGTCWPALQSLDLSKAVASMSGCMLETVLAALPGLTHLALPPVDPVQYEQECCMQELSMMRQLRGLQFSGSVHIATAYALSNLVQLTSLELGVTKQPFYSCKKSAALHHAAQELHTSSQAGIQVSTPGQQQQTLWDALPHLTNLSHLRLRGVSELGVLASAMSGLTSLNSLCLSLEDGAVADISQLGSLAYLPQLQVLDIWWVVQRRQ